ncbi:MAG: hypothetical protein JRH16_14750 [Deltaproteobacteria bacterium]|nr:hypothetical protein [Deltaproteobacteria bacterium]
MNGRDFRKLLPPVGMLLLGVTGIATTRGVAFWLAGGLVGAGLVVGVRSVLRISGASSRGRGSEVLLRAALLLGSTLFGLAVFEAWLALMEVEVPPVLFEAPAAGVPVPEKMRSEVIFAGPGEADSLEVEMPASVRRKAEIMQSARTMPIAWEHRWIRKVKGEPYRFRWQGVVHVYDTDKIRKDGPFPPRDPERIRIIAVGDSFTYGKAIAGFWAYPAQLERALEMDFEVEVLNLGSPGLASADILEILHRYLPELDPDIVFYGVCLNDFQPSGYAPPKSWVVPIPRNVEKFIIRRSRVGRFLAGRYDRLLLELGLRNDFYTDLLVDFESRSERFGRDVAAMNAFVTEKGLPPVVSMVLNHDITGDERNRRLVSVAESRLRAAGMAVIGSEPFSRTFAGRNFAVSRWDWHSNEEANAIWAKILWQHFRDRPELALHPRLRATSAERRAGPTLQGRL